MSKIKLPPIPEPPVFEPDARQQEFEKIAGNLSEQMSKDISCSNIGTANTRTGYHATSINIGILQDEIAKALHGLSMEKIKGGWKEIFLWIAEFTKLWVQRRKSLHAEPRDKGISVKIETQDDRGYYKYEFDVFPGLKISSKILH